MIELIESYGPEILQYILTGILILIVGKIRNISDTNLLDVFNKVKDQALEVTNKEIDISNTIEKVGAIADLSNKMIDNLQKELQDQMIKMTSAVLAFQEGELYTKMLAGLEVLDTLEKVIANKDDLIDVLLVELKGINQRLGVIENERRL